MFLNLSWLCCSGLFLVVLNCSKLFVEFVLWAGLSLSYIYIHMRRVPSPSGSNKEVHALPGPTTRDTSAKNIREFFAKEWVSSSLPAAKRPLPGPTTADTRPENIRKLFPDLKACTETPKGTQVHEGAESPIATGGTETPTRTQVQEAAKSPQATTGIETPTGSAVDELHQWVFSDEPIPKEATYHIEMSPTASPYTGPVQSPAASPMQSPAFSPQAHPRVQK